VKADESHGEWVRRLLEREWGSTRIVTRGRVHRADRLPAFVAVDRAEMIGLTTYNIEKSECEMVTLNSMREGIGIGSALVEAVKTAAVKSRCRRVWLITTNDNLKAIGFYQKRGFMLVAVHCNALEESRRLKPSIPMIGIDGISLRDEIEMEIRLTTY
jgi:N-acetylglutamate synthase-like GNAT family acetyltransferase